MMIEAPFILTDNLSIGFHVARNKKNSIAESINVSANRGELIAVVGRNGTGKSTLLRTLCKLQHPLSGTIKVNEQLLWSYNRNDFAKILSYVSTEIIQVKNLTVYDLVTFGRMPYTNWYGQLSENDRDIVKKTLHRMNMTELAYRKVHEISDGERQRAMIARAVAQDTNMIILDEPTAFLDLAHRYEIINILNRLAREQNKTIILSIHDLSIALREADKIWLFENGTVIQGAPEDLILKGRISNIFDNESVVFDEDKEDFIINRQTNRTICCKGKGDYYKMTVKALNRLGYNCLHESGHQETSLLINDDNPLPEWIIQEKGKKLIFNSIYDLSLHLKK